MIRVVVLGSTGMLGWAVGQHFANQPDVYDTWLSYKSDRLKWGDQTFHFNARYDEHLKKIPDADYVINCIGCIKQRHYDTDRFIEINSRFPHLLADECARRRKEKLIHVSTDCVFTGNRGNYVETDAPDSRDVYGMSKIMGESRRCMLLRTSIIGPEMHTKYSLLEWAKAQAGRPVQGYTNHFWNGVTSKQYAKICDQIIQEGLYAEGLRHVHSTTVTKQEMLEVFNEHFELDLVIEPFTHPTSIDRSLWSIHDLKRSLDIPNFADMVKQL